MDNLKYIDLLRPIILERANKSKPFAMVQTYGCQQNVSDGEKLKGMLEDMGYQLTDSREEADFIIFNTCAIREHAQDRVFGNVGALKNLKNKNPNLIIALCGCMMEQEHVTDKIKNSFPFVNLLFGTHSLHRFPKLLYDVLTDDRRIFERGIEDNYISEDLPIHRDSKFKAWLPIMYGCDNFCSYCVVPYVRGRERSREYDAVLNEAKELINKGYKEITLLGQNVNSYGKSLEGDVNFSKLLKDIDSIPGDYIIRFMTSHPKDLTFDLIDVIASSKHISKHLHLPFQSGNDRILKLMNRHYNREKYLSIIKYAKSKIPDISLTSDVIVGFPGETYDEFQDTLSLIKEVRYTSLFTFIFSPREKTPALKMDDPISHEEKVRWFDEILFTQQKISSEICRSLVGKNLRALVESEGKKDGMLVARTSGNILIEFKGDKDLIGSFQNLFIEDSKDWVLLGLL